MWGGISDSDLEMCLIGVDVIALFPNIKSKNTGKIVRNAVISSPIKIRGFDWKQGVRYILINKHLTGDLIKIWRLLPWKTKGGVMPGMTNRKINDKNEKIEEDWTFPNVVPTDEEIKQVVGRCAEIALRTIFENFCYKFGGEIYKQSSGGPIGARCTMAAARIVMNDWSLKYRKMLTEAGLKIGLLSGYVDDVRQGSTLLKLGTRFNKIKMQFEWNEEAEAEDLARMKKDAESSSSRMARICRPAMDSINEDLKFTTEVAEDFEDKRLPTLDFSMWLMKFYRINHTYFQKCMKTPYVLMKRSAMSEQQKMSILSNELIRRLSNINDEETSDDEKIVVLESYIKEMKTSEYGRKQIKESLVSGVVGWRRKQARRKTSGEDFYRSGKSTLSGRCRRKLMEKTTWYKPKRKREEEDDEFESPVKRQKMSRNWKAEKPPKNAKIKAVLFVPYTPGSELAKRLREAETKLNELTGYKLKVVERAGIKLQDLLHKADPWQGADCQRAECWPCETKLTTEKNKTQDCTKRSLIYENWCITCEEQEMDKIKLRCKDDEEMTKKLKKKIVLSKYIGETSRSIHERAWEHKYAMEQLSITSHLLKHTLDKHGEADMDKVKFGVKVLQYTRSSFQRQILESVLIQESRNHDILNSKSEYNRCALPRLSTKIGENAYKKWEADSDADMKKEQDLEARIRILKIERNKKLGKQRKQTCKIQDQPAGKRRKLGENRWKKVYQNKSEEREKRKHQEQGRRKRATCSKEEKEGNYNGRLAGRNQKKKRSRK